jgi:integral membrane protein
MSPRTLFRTVAVVEAFTWTGLLVGMYLKYVPETTEVGVKVFGPLHGAAFLAYLVVTLVVAVDQVWSRGRTTVGLLAAVPPLTTLLFDWWVERKHGLNVRWRLRVATPATRVERPVSLVVRHPFLGVLSGLGVVLGLFGLAMAAGPPV